MLSVECLAKTLPNHGSDDRANDRSGREIREPMDGHGDTQPDIAGVEDRHPASHRCFGQSVNTVTAMAKAMVVCDDGQPQKTPPRIQPKRKT